MSNLNKLELVVLNITGENYLLGALDVEIHLNAKELRNTIEVREETSTQDKAKAMIFLHHLYEGLKAKLMLHDNCSKL
uniref:Uncharacterized protein n=1 Tax=Manihot esculenta TaxID=3983 RepID=A0A2C9WKL6_MANES